MRALHRPQLDAPLRSADQPPIPAPCLSVRLYSTKSLKPLGALEYHRDTCHVVAFPSTAPPPSRTATAGEDGDDGGDDDLDDSDSDGEAADARPRMARWLVSGGLDGRVGVWELMDFQRGKDG